MDSVKVALRIRPLVESEVEMGCKTCVHRIPGEPQVAVGKSNQMFSFNYVFDELEGQNKIYDVAVRNLIDNLFKGYNVTILAYGQTGSGKTFTMGTNYNGEGELGVIPRAIYELFERIQASTDQEFKVTVSFIELYNECLYDLLTSRPREQSVVDMRDTGSGVVIPGLSELETDSPETTLLKLREASEGRVVGATNMNAQSSRSHAIFTINMRIISKSNPNEIITSKFHLVDLAGSERSKKTGATGTRFKEGVNINRGLLVLGNVISQLGEGTSNFINYRDSKLTRLLQDSLGGNSVTLMIACVSPADYNQDETLSTLRYADRARKIKNKPIVNQDPQLAELLRLRKEIEELRLRMIGGSSCPPEHGLLQVERNALQKKCNQLSKALSEALIQNTNMYEKAISIENAEATYREKLAELRSLSEALPGDDPKLQELKGRLADVETEHKKLEAELSGFSKSEVGEGSSDDEGEDGEEDPAQSGAVIERRSQHILSQSRINKELMMLNKDLHWKEELVAKLTESAGQLGLMPGISEESIAQLKAQISALQQEKEELARQIRLNSFSQTNSAKQAEFRRKRMLELEEKVGALLKKVKEQEKFIKMKEKSDEKIVALRQEILKMKQMKVRLIQEMKSENDKFKNFKAEKDREVCQLRTQNMKRQNQLRRMEQIHASQQNVLRRKLEAAAAANKRIMAALERQKATREKRMKAPSSEKIKEKILEDVELIESEHQAQTSLDHLIQDRTALVKEMNVVKESLEDDSVTEEEKIKLRHDLKQIEHDLELRSAEISDLQQKLHDIHQDDKTNKNHWESVQSMADAKVALSFLFNIFSDKIRDNISKDVAISELKDTQAEADQQLTEFESRLAAIESSHKKAIEKMEKECEDKVCVFMGLAAKHLEEIRPDDITETFKLQLQELEKLEELRRRVKELEEENERLKRSTEDPSPYKQFLMQRKNHLEKESELNTTFVLPKEEKKEKRRQKRDTFAFADEAEVAQYDTSREIDPDDLVNDPDFHITPVMRRIKVLSQTSKLGKRLTGSFGTEKCDCEGACEAGCVCAGSSCKENCSCDKSRCAAVGSPKRLRSSRAVDFDGSSSSKGLRPPRKYFDDC